MKRIILLVLVAFTARIAFAGCVDCHVKDLRLSAMLAKIDAKKAAAVQPFVPKGITLKGKHPPVAKTDIPKSCMKCHTGASKTIPPLAPMMHGIHLTRTLPVKVECLSCHTLDKAKGVMSVASGAEK